MKRRKVLKKKPVRPKARVHQAKRSRARGARNDNAQDDCIESLMAASAQALGLTIDPAWRGGVKFNLELILRLGALVDHFGLPDETEPGPVFHA